MFRGEVIFDIERGISLPDNGEETVAQLIADARKTLAPGTRFVIAQDGPRLVWVVNPRGARANAQVLREVIA